jgi:hypothetical protein
VVELACCSVRLNKVVDKPGQILAKLDRVIERKDRVADALAGPSDANTEGSAFANSLQTKGQQILAVSEAEAVPCKGRTEWYSLLCVGMCRIFRLIPTHIHLASQ